MNTAVDSQIKTVRILIADVQPASRRSLRSLLESEQDVEVVGEAADAKSVVELGSEFEPDISILDFAVFRELAALTGSATGDFWGGRRVLMMVEIPEKPIILHAFQLGARAVVTKGSPRYLWAESIRKVVAGEYWLGGETAAIIVQALCELVPVKSLATPCNYALTPRELEIVQMVAQGRSNKDVGVAFSICERTVKHHLTNIFGKLGVSNRLALALFARDNQMLLRRSNGQSQKGELSKSDTHTSASRQSI